MGNLKEELANDASELWNKVTDTNHPGFWGFMVGYCGTSAIIYTAYCISKAVLRGVGRAIREEVM